MLTTTILPLLLPAVITASIIHAPLTAHASTSVTTTSTTKRQNAALIALTNQQQGTFYTLTLAIGTPPQNITVVVDTGSPHLWVNPNCAGATGQQSYCETFAQFDYTQSSTIQDTGVSEALLYGKGEAAVEYVTDVVTLGSATIDPQIFGIALDSRDIPLGILGLSPPINGVPEYPYLLDTLVDQSLIASRAFTLDLRDASSPDGALILGGIDTGKYTGALAKSPILRSNGNSDNERYWIELEYLGMTNGDGESGALADGRNNAGLAVVFLDSGSTVTRLPTALFERIGDAFAARLGAQFDESSGFYLVDCAARSQPGSLDFGFAGENNDNNKVISVSFENFIWQYPDPDADICLLGILEDNDEPVLGDSFLRAAYVVYDQDNANIHLAQAANCGSHLVAISTGVDAVPSVTGDCSAASAVTATMATSSLAVASAAASTTNAGSSFTTAVVGPGPEGTGTASSSSSKGGGALCLTTCTSTSKGQDGETTATTAATAAGGAKQTDEAEGAANGRAKGSSIGVMIAGAVAVIAWLA